MNNIDKLIERLYLEIDFARSIATTVAGIAGLAIYLAKGDGIIAVFAAVIVFPTVRLMFSCFHERYQRLQKHRRERESAEESYKRLSEHEQSVVQAFAKAGGTVLTWSQVNALEVRGSAIESLIQRGLLGTSVTADGMRETFVLDTALFEAGVAKARSAPFNSTSKQTPRSGGA